MLTLAIDACKDSVYNIHSFHRFKFKMNYLKNKHQAIEKAINCAGTAKHLADLIGVSESTIYQWRRTEKRIPDKHCLDLAKRFDCIKLHKISPLFSTENINWLKNRYK